MDNEFEGEYHECAKIPARYLRWLIFRAQLVPLLLLLLLCFIRLSAFETTF